MLALLQLVVHELPVVPEQLRDVELVTLFVGPWELPVDEPNGTNWCLRAYPSLEALATLSEPAPARAADAKRRKGEPGVLAAFPVRWHEVADDADEPHDGLKVGGWPREVQGDVEWRENGELVEDVDFVLQVDSDEKTGFEVGHGGVLHVGRRRSTGSWHCSWQSL